MRMQKSEESENSFKLLLNGFAECAHDGFIGVSRHAERFQDLIRAVVAHNFRGENGFE